MKAKRKNKGDLNKDGKMSSYEKKKINGYRQSHEEEKEKTWLRKKAQQELLVQKKILLKSDLEDTLRVILKESHEEKNLEDKVANGTN